MSTSVVISLSPQANEIVQHFSDPKPYWQTFAQALSNRLGQEAVEHIKPMTHVSAYYQGNEALANSLAYSTSVGSRSFRVTFGGLWYGNYMDIGNFPANVGIRRSSGRAFPVGLRSAGGDYSQVTWSSTIHGMGHTTPDAPTHFSAKTAQWLADNLNTFCDTYLEQYLQELVML